MACAEHQELVKKWRLLINEPYEDDVAVVAYWAIAEHRMTCKVCKDEDLAEVLMSFS
jgi:hypothetical protein